MYDNRMTVLFGISSEIWRGSIPIELMISENDLSTSTAPSPCFLFLPRMSYLGVVAADAVDYLKSYAIDIASDVWFESLGVPLKWFDLNIFNCIYLWDTFFNYIALFIYDFYLVHLSSVICHLEFYLTCTARKKAQSPGK